MRNINEISFEEFAETIMSIEAVASENRRLFGQMLLGICQECKLAGEMFLFIRNMRNEDLEGHPELAVEHHKVILAVWLLLNDFKRPNTTLH